MRFLLDMNIPRELGRKLEAQGHSWRHVGNIGMSRANDVAIIEEARANREIIVTHDLDYGHLLAFSGESAPSVIILRLRNTHPNHLFIRMKDLWPDLERPLLGGAIVVIEDDAVRIRRLPIDREE